MTGSQRRDDRAQARARGAVGVEPRPREQQHGEDDRERRVVVGLVGVLAKRRAAAQLRLELQRRQERGVDAGRVERDAATRCAANRRIVSNRSRNESAGGRRRRTSWLAIAERPGSARRRRPASARAPASAAGGSSSCRVVAILESETRGRRQKVRPTSRGRAAPRRPTGRWCAAARPCRPTFGSQPSSSRARPMSGRRCCGSSVGSASWTISEREPGHLDDRLGQLEQRELVRVADVHRQVLAGLRQRDHAGDQVLDVTERAGLAAVAEHRDRPVGERLAQERRDRPAVVRAHPRAVGVEDPDDRRVHALLAVVGHRQRLGVALGLVVDAARADRVDVAPVLLASAGAPWDRRRPRWSRR